MIEMPLKFWGILLAAFNLTAALTSKHAHALLRIMGIRNSVFLMLALQTLVFILMAKIHLLFAFIFPMLPFVLWPVATVFTTTEINNRTDTENRATVLSLSSFMAQLSQIILLPVLGYYADLYSLAYMYLLMAGFCLIFGLVVYFNIIREV